MQAIQQWLVGKKTYLAALAAVVVALTSYANGTTDAWQTIVAIGGAIFAATIRSGISSEVRSAVAKLRPPVLKP